MYTVIAKSSLFNSSSDNSDITHMENVSCRSQETIPLSFFIDISVADRKGEWISTLPEELKSECISKLNEYYSLRYLKSQLNFIIFNMFKMCFTQNFMVFPV